MKNIAVFVDFKNGHLSGKSLNLIHKIKGLDLGVMSLFTFTESESYFLPKIDGIELIVIVSNNPVIIPDKEIVSLLINEFKKRNISLAYGVKSTLFDSLSAQIAINLGFKVKSQIVDFSFNGQVFNYTISVFNNKALAQYRNSLSPSFFIVNNNFNYSHTFDLKDFISVVFEKIRVEKSSINLKSLNTIDNSISLADASIVVGAGRGMKDSSNWQIIEQFAESLKAATACSKPVSDLNWRPHHEHVGQTGVKIAPDTYIACGISGAIQHLAGVNSSKTIVVINNDPEAPFFKNADYGIVGDLFDIVPRLTKKIKSR